MSLFEFVKHTHTHLCRYTAIPLPMMLAWVYFVGLTLDYYGDAEYMAYIKQNPNGTNDYLEPPGFNFTWDDSVRKFEHKMEYWSDTKQTIFCVAFWLGSVPASTMSFAILPLIVFAVEGTFVSYFFFLFYDF